MLGFTMALCFEGGDFGILLGGAGFHLLLLLKRHKCLLLFNLKFARQGIAVLLTDCDFNVLLDFVTFTATALSFLSQFGETFGIKGVVRVEMHFFRLVEVG